jgi:hypothetical protein
MVCRQNNPDLDYQNQQKNFNYDLLVPFLLNANISVGHTALYLLLLDSPLISILLAQVRMHVFKWNGNSVL